MHGFFFSDQGEWLYAGWFDPEVARVFSQFLPVSLL
jgi:hypothetical protein